MKKPNIPFFKIWYCILAVLALVSTFIWFISDSATRISEYSLNAGLIAGFAAYISCVIKYLILKIKNPHKPVDLI